MSVEAAVSRRPSLPETGQRRSKDGGRGRQKEALPSKGWFFYAIRPALSRDSSRFKICPRPRTRQGRPGIRDGPAGKGMNASPALLVFGEIGGHLVVQVADEVLQVVGALVAKGVLEQIQDELDALGSRARASQRNTNGGGAVTSGVH